MQNLHVGLEFDEAVQYKKQILETEINILNLAQKLQTYRGLRAEELRYREKLKTAARKLSLKINQIMKELPKVELAEIEIEEQEEKIDKKGRKALEVELKDIKRQLEELNKYG